MIHKKVRIILLAFASPIVAMAQGGTASPSAAPTLPTRVGIVSIQSAIVGTNDGQKVCKFSKRSSTRRKTS